MELVKQYFSTFTMAQALITFCVCFGLILVVAIIRSVLTPKTHCWQFAYTAVNKQTQKRAEGWGTLHSELTGEELADEARSTAYKLVNVNDKTEFDVIIITSLSDLGVIK